jgi:(p)ppGpp synthase/HD superfamily hydrolase
MDDIKIVIEAAAYAAEKHKSQRRKGSINIPYINHPLKVCKLICECGEENLDLLVAAILHDIIEDTDTSAQDIEKSFGKNVISIVLEVTDNMQFTKKKRKELQILKAPSLSREAKIIKIADKTSNISDILIYPIYWTKIRKLQYIEWSKLVFDGCKGQNDVLDMKFLETYNIGVERYKH